MCGCSLPSQESLACGQSYGSSGEAIGPIRRVGRMIAGAAGKVRQYAVAGFNFAFALALLMLFGSNAMAQTPTTPTLPDVPVLVDFSGMMDALVSAIQGYMGLVVVLLIAIGVVGGFLAWTVGRKRVV